MINARTNLRLLYCSVRTACLLTMLPLICVFPSAYAQSSALHQAVECFATEQSEQRSEFCGRKHLTVALEVWRREHARLRRLLPAQAWPLLFELDKQWRMRRDQKCQTRVPLWPTAAWITSVAKSKPTLDCLTTQFQDRTALLLVQQRVWERENLAAAGSIRAAMATYSPALDPLHDEQVREFWRWVYSFPVDEAPSGDRDGSRCALRQSGPIWFLAGNARGGFVRRTCEVAPNKRLVVPVLAVGVPAGDTENCSETRLSYYADLIKTSAMDVQLNGAALPRPAWPRMHMACLPSPEGEGQILVAGWWLHLGPLPKGVHRLAFSVRADGLQLQQDVHYELEIQ